MKVLDEMPRAPVRLRGKAIGSEFLSQQAEQKEECRHGNDGRTESEIDRYRITFWSIRTYKFLTTRRFIARTS